MKNRARSRRLLHTVVCTSTNVAQVQMFGVTSEPEKYQNIVADVLHCCEGVANLADDLIVHGCGIKEHDRNLHAVLTRLKEKGLTLNGDKCQFRLPKLTFFGHDLSRQGVAPSEEKVAAILNASPPQDAPRANGHVETRGAASSKISVP